MKNLIIIGARAQGRVLHEEIKVDHAFNKEFRIKGFLDDKIDALDLFEEYAPIISSVENYQVDKNDVFICSLGDVKYKKKYSQMIIDKGGEFYTFIHPLARVHRDAIIGEGSTVYVCRIGSAAIIGKHCLIQEYSVIGHDVIIGDWSRVDTHVVCTGGAKVGTETTIHTGAILNQNAKVGNYACVGAGSFVLKRVQDNTTVYGNPAVKLEL